jgi:hypothetical protein
MHLCPCPLHDLRQLQSTHDLVGVRNHCCVGVQVVVCGAGAGAARVSCRRGRKRTWKDGVTERCRASH